MKTVNLTFPQLIILKTIQIITQLETYTFKIFMINLFNFLNLYRLNHHKSYDIKIDSYDIKIYSIR